MRFTGTGETRDSNVPSISELAPLSTCLSRTALLPTGISIRPQQQHPTAI
jgi:hypothetical protein